MPIFWVFAVTVSWIAAGIFPIQSLRPKCRPYLAAAIFCVPFVDDILEWGKFIVSFGGINIVVDGNKTGIMLGENYLCVISGLKVIASKS